jgi:hypothetical protein
MAEKTATTKKKPPLAAKQELQAILLDVQKAAEERRDAETTPAQRIEQRAAQSAVASADALTLENVVKDITQLRSSVGRTLSQIAESLEAEVDKYQQVKKAIEIKEKELAEIYDIQRQAVSLTALLEAQQRKRDDFEAEMARDKEDLEKEVSETRAQWETEQKDHEAQAKEQSALDAKTRQRERDEYQYKFTREQQLSKDQFADEKARIERELTLRREELESQLNEREAAVAAREKELADLRERAAKFPADLEAAVARAAKDAAARAQADAAGHEELLKREFTGEKNVLSTRIVSLEQTVKDQAEQIKQLSQKMEKAYGQVQEIAVRAIEGSSNSKTLAGVQQLLADQGRKAEGKAG